MSYPPPPWQVEIAGYLVATAQLVDTERIKSLIPPEFEIVTPLPGKTIGGLFVARYGPGSTVEYNEFGAFPAFVKFGGKTGIWVGQMYVDNETSLRLAHEELGLPKEMAEFVYGKNSENEIILRQGNRVICSIDYRRPIFLPWRQTINGGAFGVLNSRVVHFAAQLKMKPGFVRARVEIPPDSPIASFGLDHPLITACVKDARGILAKDLVSLGIIG